MSAVNVDLQRGSRPSGVALAVGRGARPWRPEPVRPGFDGMFEGSLASVVRGLAARGLRTLLVTSGAAGEGKSTVTAQIGLALARSGRESAVLVDADPFRPSLPRLLGLRATRGLAELIEDTYLGDLGREQAREFGVGDWFEVLRAQGRTGDLTLTEGDRVCVVRFVQGAPASLMTGDRAEGGRLGERLVGRGDLTRERLASVLELQPTTGRMLGDLLSAVGGVTREAVTGALREQAAERVTQLVAFAQPECRFQELAEPYLPASGGRAPATPSADGIDALIDARLRRYLRDPFLSNEVAASLTETSARNLHLLAQGSRPCDFTSAPHLAALPLLAARLARTHDVVLVDAPPVSLTTSTVAMAARVDGVLLVVKAEASRRRTLRRAVEELRRAGANVVGAVLNHVDVADDETLTPYYRFAVAPPA